MAPRARCGRVHSALTQKVTAIEAINDQLHAAWQEAPSGQLPFLGSKPGSGSMPPKTISTGACGLPPHRLFPHRGWGKHPECEVDTTPGSLRADNSAPCPTRST
jgi:hypothetical protein